MAPLKSMSVANLTDLKGKVEAAIAEKVTARRKELEMELSELENHDPSGKRGKERRRAKDESDPPPMFGTIPRHGGAILAGRNEALKGPRGDGKDARNKKGGALEPRLPVRCRASRPFGTIGRRRETFRSLDYAAHGVDAGCFALHRWRRGICRVSRILACARRWAGLRRA